MPDIAEVNDDLHRRVRRAIDSGAVRVLGTGSAPPESTSFVELVVKNANAGRRLLHGMKLYRGARDPDVDAGSFDDSVKHATPLFFVAQGYAVSANAHIGLASKETQGLGMIAEYDMPEDAVLNRNFGWEDSAKGAQGLTVRGAEDQLKPLIAAYLEAGSAMARDRAQSELLSFAERHLYEVALPAQQPAVRQWVVEDDATKGVRFLEHQDRGPLADVLIDVVKARKAAVDEFMPSMVAAGLRRGGNTGLDALDDFSPGLASALRDTARSIDATSTGLRTKSFSVSPSSLSDAIAWRKDALKSVRISRLSNTGTTIEHDHPDIRLMPLLQTAMAELELASGYQRTRAKQSEVLGLVKTAEADVAARDALRPAYEAAKARVSTASQAFDECRRSRSEASERLDAIERRHVARLGEGFFARLRYRFDDQKKVEEAITLQQQRVAGWEKKLDRLSTQWSGAKSDFDKQHRIVTGLSDRVTQHEARLQAFSEAEHLAFIPPNAREQLSRLDHQQWSALGSAITRELAEIDSAIARGRERASLFKSFATYGVASGYAMHRVQAVAAQNEWLDSEERSVRTNSGVVRPEEPAARELAMVDAAGDSSGGQPHEQQRRTGPSYRP